MEKLKKFIDEEYNEDYEDLEDYVISLLKSYRLEACEFRQRLIDVKAESRRWSTRMQMLEDRIYHAMETLGGELMVPEINEIRKVRGLELL